ncbi:MAG: ribosome biogenesis GTPase Der [candidate division WOR-3 bacterium]|nr:MAG: ribosome biogenesis GTPase Der [candidate division WOR-3 bacterium]
MSTVVIVGRKNVGKSTVFNRLAQMRLSVVYKEPGVTRDRLYGEVEWRGKTFSVIDTGGFFPDEDALLAQKITQQIDLALQQADLIYFVVDGKDGMKPGDETICAHLRKMNKTIFLLVNKCDHKQFKTNVHDFNAFGFEHVFHVSAEAGTGFGDLLDKTMTTLPKPYAAKKHRIPRVLILGRPNAGKSTLLNSLAGEERVIVHEKPGTTRDLVSTVITYNEQQYELIDTCGLRRSARVKDAIEFYSLVRATAIIEKIDVAVLLFDTTQGVVDQDRRICRMILSRAKGLVIAPNKVDLFAQTDIDRIIESTYRSFPSMEFIPIIPISAQKKKGTEKLLQSISDIIREKKKTVDKKVLQSIVSRIQQPTGGELVHVRQTATDPPVFRATMTTSVKDNYIKYLRNTLRNYFGFSGVPILIKTRVIKHRGRLSVS